jgi:hypothetical protein
VFAEHESSLGAAAPWRNVEARKLRLWEAAVFSLQPID